MKSLYLLRHAKSSWDSPAANDFDRPLADRGLKDAPKMGKAFLRTGLPLDLIRCSTAKRARETCQLFVKGSGFAGTVDFEPSIYEASVETLFGVLRTVRDVHDSVMLVGHNPGFEDLAGALCGHRGTPASVLVPTCTLVAFQLAIDRWKSVSPGDGTLVWMLIPKIL